MSGSGCKGCKNAQSGGCGRGTAGQPMFPVSFLMGDPHQTAQAKAKAEHDRRNGDCAAQRD